MEHLRRNLSLGVQAPPADVYTVDIHIKTLTDAKFNVESDEMVYLTSIGRADKDICKKRQK